MLDTYKWLNTATAKILFGPDRRAVYRELEDHIQELRERKEAAGLDGEAAERQALEAMGPPEDIAGELGRLHRPWWGWLWRCSQVLLAAVVIWALAAAVIHGGGLRPAAPPLPEQGIRLAHPNLDGEDVRTVTEIWEPEGSRALGGYRFTVPMAWVETWQVPEEDGGTRDCCQLVVYLRADTWRFWESCESSQYMILRNTAADSAGRWYAYDGGGPAFFCESGGGSFSTWFLVEMALPGPADAPDWVEIPVGYGSCSLRVNLAEEVVS